MVAASALVVLPFVMAWPLDLWCERQAASLFAEITDAASESQQALSHRREQIASWNTLLGLGGLCSI